MRGLILCLGLWSACAAGAGVVPEQPDWGAKVDDILATEAGQPVLRTPDRLVYHIRLRELPLTAVYRFSNGKLHRVRYLNRAVHTDRNDYIEDYARLRASLTERLGEPALDRKQWRQPLFRDRPERHGDAIAAGHLVYLVQWRATKSQVTMALRSDRRAVTHEVVFEPKGD